MTSLTLVTLAVIVFGAVNSRGYGRALAIGGGTPVGAALVVGGVAVPTFYAIAIGAAVGLAGRLLARTRRLERLTTPPAPGVVLLVVFAAWSILVTLLAPFLFAGQRVLTPGGAAILSPGLLTQSNIAQAIYLVLGVCVVVFLSRARWAGPEIIGTAVALPVLLSLWKYLADTYGLTFPVGFFDNSPSFAFIQTAAGDVERFRGILSEPSGLGGACLVAIAYMLSRAQHVEGLRRVGVLLVVVAAAFLGILSTSATFVVAGVLLAAVAGAVAVGRLVLQRGPLSLLTVSMAWAAAIAALWFLPILANLFEQVVDDKVASTSFTERSGADAYSFGLVLDTLGIGVGLGSNRPSSFVAGLLSTVGIVGVGLLVAVVWAVIRGAYPLRAYRPVVWALAAVLIPKAIAGPDLNDTSGLMWMCLGVLAYAASKARRAAAPRALDPPLHPAPVPSAAAPGTAQ